MRCTVCMTSSGLVASGETMNRTVLAVEGADPDKAKAESKTRNQSASHLSFIRVS